MTIEHDPIFGCRLATSRLDRDGYAYSGNGPRAHVIAYVEAYGPVPDGLVIDHLCRRRNCTAPHHLEAVSPSENERRKKHAYRMKRKRCKAGHDMAINRVLVGETGGCVCRECNRAAMAAEGAM